MATAGSANLTTDATAIYSDTDGCTDFWVYVPLTAAAAVDVRAVGLHDSGEYVTLEQGQDIRFVLLPRTPGLNPINTVYAKANSGTSTVRYCVAGRNA